MQLTQCINMEVEAKEMDLVDYLSQDMPITYASTQATVRKLKKVSQSIDRVIDFAEVINDRSNADERGSLRSRF